MRRLTPAATLLLLAAATAAEKPLSFLDLRGGVVEVAPADAGGAVVLHFWASWCPSCLEELPPLERAAGACRGAPVRVWAVNTGEGAEEVAAFVAKHGIGLPVLRDPKGRVWRELSGQGLPLNVVWRGDIRRVEVGPRSEDAWRAELAALGCGAEPPRPAR
jgi:thiol-disulfide isomerase/thioredoxin